MKREYREIRYFCLPWPSSSWGAPPQAQVGAVIWEDNFNNLDNWIKLTGNGSWGWGNGELEYYQEENVDIAAIPGESGNNAMRITARQESGPGIVDQWGNPLYYTSGKVISKSMVSVKYGMIETRMWVPDIDLAGWPAVWLLGNANYAWPRCGEFDMMEMGSPAVIPRSPRHPQRRQWPEQFHGQPGRGRQRHFLFGGGHQSWQPLRGLQHFL